MIDTETAARDTRRLHVADDRGHCARCLRVRGSRTASPCVFAVAAGIVLDEPVAESGLAPVIALRPGDRRRRRAG